MKTKTPLKKHHAKPVRKRHVGLSLAGIILLVAAAYLLGFGSNKLIDSFTPVTKEDQRVSSVSIVKSSLGYTMAVDRNMFDIEATRVSEGEVTVAQSSELASSEPLTSVRLYPNTEKVAPIEGATRFEIQMLEEASDLTQSLANKNPEMTVEQVVADYFQPKSGENYTTRLVTRNADVLSGLNVERRVYETKTSLGGRFGEATTYSVYWSGLVNQKPMNISLTGLVGGSAVPSVYESVLDSLSFDLSVSAAINSRLAPVSASIPGFAVANAQAEVPLPSKFIADLVSPSVVKIYSAVCGIIAIDGSPISNREVCNGGTGTGFFVSNNGVVATNGHVVVLEPTDLFVSLLLSDTNSLISYLSASGLSNSQIAAVLSDQSVLSAVISSIYEEAENRLTLQNESSRILVAIANDPVDIGSPEEFFSFSTSDTIFEATLEGYDYQGKDIYAAQSIEQGEFSASDVALLQIDIDNTPALPLATEEPTQNESVTVLGYPGDAENSLVSDESLAITVTNGVISSIRQATGSNSKLYQSDVDASSGNSGGPAVDETGSVLGLLTYRFTSGSSTDASKSYIRDIQDLKDLANSENVTIEDASETFMHWQTGLELFSQNRFSKAKEEFAKVSELYPAHRLVDSYVDRADTAIAEGRDVKDFPLILTVAIAAGGALMLGGGVFLFLRHNKHHKLHLLQQNGVQSPISQSYAPSNAPSQTAAAQSSITPTPSTTSVASQVTNASPAPPPNTPSPTPQPAQTQPQPIQPTVISPSQPADSTQNQQPRV